MDPMANQIQVKEGVDFLVSGEFANHLFRKLLRINIS